MSRKGEEGIFDPQNRNERRLYFKIFVLPFTPFTNNKNICYINNRGQGGKDDRLKKILNNFGLCSTSTFCTYIDSVLSEIRLLRLTPHIGKNCSVIL